MHFTDMRIYATVTLKSQSIDRLQHYHRNKGKYHVISLERAWQRCHYLNDAMQVPNSSTYHTTASFYGCGACRPCDRSLDSNSLILPTAPSSKRC